MIKDCKKCRREGMKLHLKGERCLSAKCAVTRRPYAPGDHGQSFRGKLSEYGKQLREKQKARKIYGVAEGMFKKYVNTANTMLGNNTENLLRLLEIRLDNVIFRMGFASSRSQARQFVSHGLFKLNGRNVKTASIQAKVGDVITAKNPNLFKEISLNKNLTWIDVDQKKYEGTIKHLPGREEIDIPVNESLIIEFYSR